jgi:hypothetical protein
MLFGFNGTYRGIPEPFQMTAPAKRLVCFCPNVF